MSQLPEDEKAKRNYMDHWKKNLLDHLEVLKPYLLDYTMTDLRRNGATRTTFIKRFKKGKEQLPDVGDVYVEVLINYIASLFNVPDRPTLDTVVKIEGTDYDFRIHAGKQPEAPAPFFSIRQKPRKVWTIEEYLNEGRISQVQADFLKDQIKAHKSIFLAGSTGSGKTSFVNCIINLYERIHPDDRIVLVEDVGELQFSGMDVELHVVPTNRMATKVFDALRENPDVIGFGEIRDGHAAAAYLDQALNSGHEGGFATVHANSAPLALVRLRSLLAKAGIDRGGSIVNSTVNTVVFLKNVPGFGPKVMEIIEVQPKMNERQNGQFVYDVIGEDGDRTLTKATPDDDRGDGVVSIEKIDPESSPFFVEKKALNMAVHTLRSVRRSNANGVINDYIEVSQISDTIETLKIK